MVASAVVARGPTGRPAGFRVAFVRAGGDGGTDFFSAHVAHVPVISTVWAMSEKPLLEATFSAQRSTVGPSTSTVYPQCRHTRW